MPSVPHLLHFRISHFNEKVRWALDYKGWYHTREALVPGFHIPQVRIKSKQNQVPVLIIDNQVFRNSSDILRIIERDMPTPALFPTDSESLKRIERIEKYFDEHVGPDLRRLFWSCYLPHPQLAAKMATDGFGSATYTLWRAAFPMMKPLLKKNMTIYPKQLQHARSKLSEYFDRVQQEVGPSGYIIGDTFSIADLCVASIMAALVSPPEFPYPLPKPEPSELTELRNSMSNHAGFQWVREIYRKHRGSSFESF